MAVCTYGLLVAPFDSYLNFYCMDNTKDGSTLLNQVLLLCWQFFVILQMLHLLPRFKTKNYMILSAKHTKIVCRNKNDRKVLFNFQNLQDAT